MPEPTDAARANRLAAIRERATDERNTSTAALDRRWLLGEVERLTTELLAEEADKAEVVHREESLRIDAEDQLKQAERTIRELRDQIDYWKMSQ